MSKLRQLAITWQKRADADAQSARTHETVRQELAAIAQTRRNDAWELLRVLDTQEQESPLNGGPLCTAQTNNELGL